MENYVIVTPDRTKILPDGLTSPDDWVLGFLVKEWSFKDAGKAVAALSDVPAGSDEAKLAAKFPYINIPKPNLFGFRLEKRYDWYYADVKDEEGIAGQGVKDPASLFANHQFVQMEVEGRIKWYDPSYGLVYDGDSEEARLEDFENKAISGYSVDILSLPLVHPVPVKEDALGTDLNGDGDTMDIVDDKDVSLFKKNDTTKREVRAELKTYY